MRILGGYEKNFGGYEKFWKIFGGYKNFSRNLGVGTKNFQICLIYIFFSYINWNYRMIYIFIKQDTKNFRFVVNGVSGVFIYIFISSKDKYTHCKKHSIVQNESGDYYRFPSIFNS